MSIKHSLLVLLLAYFTTQSAYAVPTSGVVASIKPLHSLVSSVMGNTGEARLLIAGTDSPHDFQLKPSQMKALQDAKIVFYIDDSFETFLNDAFRTLPDGVRKAALAEETDITFLPIREGGAWEGHNHDHHGHGHHDDHDSGEQDMHFWLDPENARRMVISITKTLSTIYPENRNIYKTNARTTIKRIDAVDAELKASLEGVKDKPFIVFHDAYQYFEHAYDLTAVGSITFEPDESPSPRRIKEVRAKLKEAGASCIFREPQFSDRLINTVIEGTEARKGTLDPLGASLETGPDLYPKLLQALANDLKNCLGK